MADRAPVASVLRGVDFVPLNVRALRVDRRDRFGRQMYRPMVEAMLSGSSVQIVPMDLGQFSSADDAVRDGVSWSQMV